MPNCMQRHAQREEQPTTCLKQAYLRIISCTGAAAAAATPWDELGAGERAVRSFLALEAIFGAPAAWKFLSQVRPGYHGCCTCRLLIVPCFGWWPFVCVGSYNQFYFIACNFTSLSGVLAQTC